MHRLGIVGMTVTLVCATAATALAQENNGEATTAPIAAPREAFELDVNTGYTHGFGAITGGTGGAVADVARGGVGVGLGLGYRIDPRVAIGATGQLHGLAAAEGQPTGTRVRGGTVGIEGKFHLLPYERVDPWVGIGTGYRLLSIASERPNSSVLYHGFELARAQVGLDVRVSRDIALGPVVGGDINLFVWRNPEGPVGNEPIVGKKVSSFVFAGIQGRFDIAGRRQTPLGAVETGRR